MNLDLLNNILDHVKENKVVKNFVKELSNYLEKTNNELSNEKNIKNDGLKQEDCLYQVAEMTVDGAYLQNTNNNQIYEEKDIPKNILDKIGNDTILRYKNGEYIIEEEMTEKFFNNLVDIKEYKEIQNKFIEESHIDKIDENTRYRVKEHGEDYSVLSYEDNEIKVPNVLIPFFASEDTILYYKDGKFNRDL